MQRLIDSQHPDKEVRIDWRDAGEGWPDTWLGFSFPTDQNRPLAAALSKHGARVLHEDDAGVIELREGKVVHAMPAIGGP
jgi:hypothetical protein